MESKVNVARFIAKNILKPIVFQCNSTSGEFNARRNSKESPRKPAVYKKRAAPVPAARDDIIRSTTVDRSAVNPELSSVIGKLNPVKEMQILGRTNSHDVSASIPMLMQPF